MSTLDKLITGMDCVCLKVCLFEEVCLFNLEQVARMQHVHSESYLVYNIMSTGEIECSNTLEDELDQALPSQAFIYRPVRQRVYSLLLGDWKGESQLVTSRVILRNGGKCVLRGQADNRFCLSVKSVLEDVVKD